MILEPMSIQSPQRARKTMAELRLRRLIEHNARLKEDLIRPRIPVSQASQSLIDYCKTTRDPLLPSVWGELRRGEDPYAPPDAGCCSVM